MKLLGIDAGVSGAWCLLDTTNDETIIEDAEMEPDRTLNCSHLFSRLVEWEPDAAIIENCFRPNSLVQMVGEYLACMKLFQTPVTKIAVTTWKRAVLSQNTSDKKVSIACAQQLYPTADIYRLSPKKKKPVANADRSEAVLLAHYLKSISR